MDNLGKIALIGGTGILLGAAIQKAADIREKNDAEFTKNQYDMEKQIREQKVEIDRLKRVQDQLLERKT